MQKIYIINNEPFFWHILEKPDKYKTVTIMKLPKYDLIVENVNTKDLIEAPLHLIIAARLRGEI